jgi:hypothetical protein
MMASGLHIWSQFPPTLHNGTGWRGAQSGCKQPWKPVCADDLLRLERANRQAPKI